MFALFGGGVGGGDDGEIHTIFTLRMRMIALHFQG